MMKKTVHNIQLRTCLAKWSCVLLMMLGLLSLGTTKARAATGDFGINIHGIQNGAVVSGTLHIWSQVSGNPKRIVYDLSGPVNMQYKVFGKPYRFRGIKKDGTSRGFNTDKYPEGQYTLKATASAYHKAPTTVTVHFTVRHKTLEITDPSATTATDQSNADTTNMTTPATSIAFAASAPSEYVLGSGRPIYFTLNGYAPKDAYVTTQVWHNDRKTMIAQYRHKITRKPWRIEASKLDLIPPGDTRLHIVLRVPNQADVKVDKWITFVVGQTTSGGGANDGSTTNPTPDTTTTDTTTTGSTTTNSTTDSTTGTNTTDSGTTTSTDTGSTGNGNTSTGQPPQTQNAFLGMNLGAVNYWAGAWTFVDVMKQATYRGMNGDWKRYTVYVGLNGHYPQGEYTPQYSGDGEVNITYRTGIVIQTRGDVRDLKVWMPGFAPGEPGYGQTFHPLFLERLRPFKTIRFMNWQGTNHAADQIEWADRATPQDETQGNGKVALEYMIQLANELGANPWLCMPHMASDDYVRNFAVMCRDQVDPNLKIYVEYSNEVWNGHFGQAQWIKAQAALNGRSKIEQWAYQAGRDFDIWMDVFAGQTHRIVRVAAGQENNPWVTQTLAENLDGNFDAIASTAYFGNKAARTLGSAATPQALIEEALRDLAATRGPNRARHGQMARDWSTILGRNIPYISYETGQHLVKTDLVSTATINATQDLPEMYDAYLKNLQSFEGAGGSLYMTFIYIRKNQDSGAWGHLQYQDQPLSEALKYRAVIDYPNSNARLQLSQFD